MTNTEHQVRPPEDHGVRTLFHAATGDVVGYAVRGAKPGPRALVVGRRGAASDAYHRLTQLPSLPRMQGELLLMFDEALDDPYSGVTRDGLYDRDIDGSIYLSVDAEAIRERSRRAHARKEAYWSILRLCAQLGIISGRGVPHLADPAPEPKSPAKKTERLPGFIGRAIA